MEAVANGEKHCQTHLSILFTAVLVRLQCNDSSADQVLKA